jgi:3-oxoacyl-[acyl-carrier-protein] synthase III
MLQRWLRARGLDGLTWADLRYDLGAGLFAHRTARARGHGLRDTLRGDRDEPGSGATYAATPAATGPKVPPVTDRWSPLLDVLRHWRRPLVRVDAEVMVRLRRRHSVPATHDGEQVEIPTTSWMLTERSPDSDAAPYVARIAGVGRRLPDTHLSTEALMSRTRHHTRIDLERLTGIHERRVSVGDEDSLTLAIGAARDCLARSGRRADDIDLVVSCSITKYRDGLVQWLEPTMSLAVARAIGATGAITFDLSNACAGTLTGVLVANNWVRRGAIRRALVVSGEYISQLGTNAARHVHSILSRELASLTLGDAGGAVLVERAEHGEPGIGVAGFTTVADHSRLCLAYPARHEAGARMFTKARAIHRVAIADTPVLLNEVLAAAGLRIDEIDHVIPHQTSARAIRTGERLVNEMLGGAPRNPAVVTVDRFGNTASTTHVVALVEELDAERLRAGDRVALLALASGLEIGVVLFTVDEGLEACRGNGH